MAPATNIFGDVSWTQKVALVANVVFHMPLVLLWTLLTSPFHPHNAHKTWTRIIAEKSFYHLTKRLSVRQLQWAMGTTKDVYTTWAKWSGVPVVIDELGDDTRLLWIGKRPTRKVILYFHGGAYLLPVPFFAQTFWKHTVAKLREQDIDVSCALLNYTLVPTATFPTQLKQAVRAVQHLLSTGVHPGDIQITGDSAGANLILQLFSHILHPLAGVPRLTLASPLRGAYLISPWVSLSGRGGSLLANDSSDTVGTRCLADWGAQVLAGVPDAQRAYAEALRAPDAWFAGLDGVVGRVLVTYGDAECLRDEIAVVAGRIARDHADARVVAEEHGVHDGPYFDFLFMEREVGEVTRVVWRWLADGFGKA